MLAPLLRWNDLLDLIADGDEPNAVVVSDCREGGVITAVTSFDLSADVMV